MRLTIHNRPLLRAWLASATMLAGVAACGGDRAETGSSSGQPAGAATVADTGVAAAQSALIDRDTSTTDTTSGAAPATPQPDTKTNRKNVQKTMNVAPDTSVSGYQAMGGDSPAPAAADTGRRAEDTVVVGDSAEIGKTGERLEPTRSSEQANADSLTSQTESDRVRPPEDSTELLGSVTTSDSVAAGGDNAVAGSAEMARDTSTGLAQADTADQVQVDTTTQVTDTSVQVAADTSAAIQVQVDTATPEPQSEVAVANEEVQVAADQAPAAAAGAPATGSMVTGAAAVAQVTRQGRRCAVVDTGESEEDIRWDMTGSPATMNPCGTGTMTLPRIHTEK